MGVLDAAAGECPDKAEYRKLVRMTRRSAFRPGSASEVPLTQEETIKWLLNRSQRTNRTVPIRRAFVQDTEDGPVLQQKPGPLASLMRHERALDLLLLMYAVTSGGDFSVTERAETWGRASGVSFATDGSASAPISRLWRKLEDLQLIERSFEGRLLKVTKLLEDGSGKAYTRPTGSETSRKDVYFQLPYQYWDEGLHKKLRMPGKVVMLIGMSLRKAKFPIVPETYQKWYGVSQASLRRGIDQLVEAQLLDEVDQEVFTTGETATGLGTRTLYAFRPPYHLNVNKTDRDDGGADSAGDTPTSGLPGAQPVFSQPSPVFPPLGGFARRPA
ncbi:hypothetical protein ACIRVK_13400 [Streptomyces sp. NPDC101152]|uniref:hypothetical protein n=1 Tax=Streptomyces sp. NPDC101152 TaxID=3366116 RepID=UPI0037FBA8A3